MSETKNSRATTSYTINQLLNSQYMGIKRPTKSGKGLPVFSASYADIIQDWNDTKLSNVSRLRRFLPKLIPHYIQNHQRIMKALVAFGDAYLLSGFPGSTWSFRNDQMWIPNIYDSLNVDKSKWETEKRIAKYETDEGIQYAYNYAVRIPMLAMPEGKRYFLAASFENHRHYSAGNSFVDGEVYTDAIVYHFTAFSDSTALHHKERPVPHVADFRVINAFDKEHWQEYTTLWVDGSAEPSRFWEISVENIRHNNEKTNNKWDEIIESNDPYVYNDFFHPYFIADSRQMFYHVPIDYLMVVDFIQSLPKMASDGLSEKEKQSFLAMMPLIYGESASKRKLNLALIFDKLYRRTFEKETPPFSIDQTTDVFGLIALHVRSIYGKQPYQNDNTKRSTKLTDMKNHTDKTKQLMKNSLFRGKNRFSKLEYDDDIVVPNVLAAENSFDALLTSHILPSPQEISPKEKMTLRFRKLGREHADGMIIPIMALMVIDHISSFIHEYGHFFDIFSPEGQMSMQSLSSESDFDAIREGYTHYLMNLYDEMVAELKQNMSKDKETDKEVVAKIALLSEQLRYFTIPTEIFARAFETYMAKEVGLQSILLGTDKDRLVESKWKGGLARVAYEAFDQPELRQKVAEYFSQRLPINESQLTAYHKRLDELNAKRIGQVASHSDETSTDNVPHPVPSAQAAKAKHPTKSQQPETKVQSSTTKNSSHGRVARSEPTPQAQPSATPGNSLSKREKQLAQFNTTEESQLKNEKEVIKRLDGLFQKEHLAYLMKQAIRDDSFLQHPTDWGIYIAWPEQENYQFYVKTIVNKNRVITQKKKELFGYIADALKAAKAYHQAHPTNR